MLNIGFYSIAPVTSKAVPSAYFSFCFLVSSVSNFQPDRRGAVVVSPFYVGLFSRALRREEHCKQISLACVHSDSATLGLPLLVACVLSQSTLLRLLCWELPDAGPGLHALPRSKPLRFRFSGTPQRPYSGPVFCTLSSTKQLRHQVLSERTLPRRGGASHHLPRPSCLVPWVCSGSTVSGVLCVSSGVLISSCNPPGGCQLSRVPGRLG